MSAHTVASLGGRGSRDARLRGAGLLVKDSASSMTLLLVPLRFKACAM